MTHRLITWQQTAAQPWRNGGGLTRELLAWPAGDGWRLRISVADITADGAFSVFAGVRRWLVVLQGAGIELSIDGAVHPLPLGAAPLGFAGDATTLCRLLDGPTRDINLMLRGLAGRLQTALPGRAWRPQPSAAALAGLFSAVAGVCWADDLAIAVPASALLWFDTAPQTLRFEPAGPLAGTAQSPHPTGWWISALPGATA